MTRILFALVVLAAAASAAYWTHPDEATRAWEATVHGARWAWAGIEANPLPAGLAVGTFLLTVVYHKAKGKSLRESVEAAATRVTVVQVPAQAGSEDETPVVRRAKARATRAQLLADQIGLENRSRKLPDEIVKAEKEASYTEQALLDAERKLADRRQAHEAAAARLDALRQERAAAEGELAAIDAELRKLAEVV